MLKNLSETDKKQLIGCLIDIVEDWLDEKGITPETIPNPERDCDNPAIIYGDDYDFLANKFEETLNSEPALDDRAAYKL